MCHVACINNTTWYVLSKGRLYEPIRRIILSLLNLLELEYLKAQMFEVDVNPAYYRLCFLNIPSKNGPLA